jgi:signal transduction histidine kinase
MHAFLGVPVHVRGRSVGNLYLANKRRGGTFTVDDQRLVEQFALHAGLAIETARLHAREARLAVIEERDRIGRDLHDGVIQRLYAVTLQLEDVPELVDEAPTEAQTRVDRSIDAIQAAIGDIRDFIYGLGSEAAVNGEFGGDLELLADEVELASGIEVRVIGSDIRLPDGTRLELLAIVREALSNVVRHARAMTATVTVRRTERGASITVADDGRGFTPGPGDPDHHGLANMRARALDLGGRLEVRSTPGEGTRIIASVPLDRGAEKGAR